MENGSTSLREPNISKCTAQSCEIIGNRISSKRANGLTAKRASRRCHDRNVRQSEAAARRWSRYRRYTSETVQCREGFPRSSNKQVHSHKFRCRRRDGCRSPVFGSGQYRPPTGFGKQFLHPATKLCLPGSLLRRRGSFVLRLYSHAIERSNRCSRCPLRAPAIRAL